MKRNREYEVMRDFMGVLGRSSGETEGISAAAAAAAFLSSSETTPPLPPTLRVRQIGDQASSKTFSSFPIPSIFPHGQAAAAAAAAAAGFAIGQAVGAGAGAGLGVNSRPNFATSGTTAALGALGNSLSEKPGSRGGGGAAAGGGGGFIGFSGGSLHQKTRPPFATSAMLAGGGGSGKKDHQVKVVVADDSRIIMGGAALPSSSAAAAVGAGAAVSEGGRERAAAHANGKPLEELAASDIQQLSREDCWRLILEVGTQWPSWNKTLNLQSQHGLTSMDRASTRKLLEQGVPVTDESNSQRSFEATHVHQFENSNTSRMLASRALEELARTPSQSASIPSVFPSSHATTSSTTTGVSNLTPSLTAAVAATVPAAAAAVAKQPPSVAVTASSAANQQRAFASNTSGKRTAQLTIFYAGAVNVFDDVTQEKAHLIMLLAANGESWTSAVAKFISLQGDSMVAPPITNADAKPAVQTTGTAYSPPVASDHNTSSAGAPDVIPSLTLAQTQQQHSSLSSLPLLVNIRDSKLTIAPNSAAVPSSAQQDQSISQGPTHSQQQQEATTMPANVKGEQSTNGASLAHLQSMQGESNSGLSAIQQNRESQPPELPGASNSSSVPTTTTTTGLNALHKSSTICYTQELPHARKNSLARFFDMRQRQKRWMLFTGHVTTTTTTQNSSKLSVDSSPLPGDPAAASSLPRTEDAAILASIKTSQPSSSPSMSPQPVEGKDAAIATSGKAVEKSTEESAGKLAANDEEAAAASPMETDTVAATAVRS